MINQKTYTTFDSEISPSREQEILILKQPISQSTKEKTMERLEGVPWDFLGTDCMQWYLQKPPREFG